MEILEVRQRQSVRSGRATWAHGAAAVLMAILGCGTPVEDRSEPGSVRALTPLTVELVESQSLEVPGQLSWDIERVEGAPGYLDWFRRNGEAIQIARVDVQADGSLALRGSLQRIGVSEDETLDRWGREALTGIMSRRNPQNSPRDPQVIWTEGPAFLTPMQVRGDFLCIEDRVSVPFPPPCGDSYGVIRICGRRGDSWVLLSTIRRKVEAWPSFEATDDRWCLLTRGEGGLEAWVGERGGGYTGSRLAKPGTFKDAGLCLSLGRPVVAWADAEGRSFLDWDGERFSLPGIQLDGRASCCDLGDVGIGFLQTKAGLPVVVRVGTGREFACSAYPVQRDGRPIAARVGDDVVVWWVDRQQIVRDHIRVR
ncbi:MAG: hypothetical protein IT452_11200 [Planctomycetia bacterium]|nr:hypothetical protein [Planctomycetia bacterium]